MRILILEDRASDAELLERALRKSLPGPRVAVVRDREGLVCALADPPDVIVSDYSVPGTGALDCLELLASRGLDVPVIVVTGTLGDEAAAECMRRGATDYLIKDRLSRLGGAVNAAIERRRIQATLHQGEAALRHAQALAGLAHVVTGRDGSFESWSATLPQLLGVSSAQLPRSTREWLEYVHPDDRELFRGTAIEAGRRGTRMDIEYRVRRADGGWAHVRQAMDPIGGSADQGDRMRWFNTLLDITGQSRAMEALRASEERHRAMFDQTAVGVAHTSLEGEVLMVNPAFCEMTGYGRAEAILLNIRDLTHPEDIARSVEGRARMAQGTGAPYERELRLVRKDRSLLWVSVTTSLLRGSESTAPFFISIVRDVSERKRAQQALAESEERFRSLTELSSDWFWQTDAEHRFVNTPRRTTEITGLTASTYVGKRRWEVPGLAPLTGDWNEHWRVLERRETYRDLILVQTRADGSKVYLQISGEPVYGAEGAFKGYRGTAKDVSESVRMQQSVREAERRYRSIFENAALGIFKTSPDGRVLDVNPAMVRMLGYDSTREVIE